MQGYEEIKTARMVLKIYVNCFLLRHRVPSDEVTGKLHGYEHTCGFTDLELTQPNIANRKAD